MYVLTHTIVNPCLDDTEMFSILANKKPESLIEWAARLCYNSNAKMGTTQEFIPGLIKVGHLDVLEHVSLSVKMPFYPTLEPEARYYWYYLAKRDYPYLDIIIRDGSAILSANMRVWLEMHWDSFSVLDAFLEKDQIELQYYLNHICPHVIPTPTITPEIERAGGHIALLEQAESTYKRVYRKTVNARAKTPILHPETATDVTLLGYSLYLPENNIFYATLQYDGVSRAWLAQHTRHRLLSHSALSQRYVDQSNSWPVIPSNVTNETRLIIEDDYARTMTMYEKLRKNNKKEDARMILPNCTNTSIVSSANYKGWMHYLKLRTAKDAQFEIRQTALATQKLLQPFMGE